MIKNKHFLILLFSANMIFTSCQDRFDCFKSAGKTITKERSLSTFSKINLGDNVDLKIEYGAVNKCTVTAGKNLIDGVKTQVLNQTLTIRNDNTCNWVRSFKNDYVVNITIDSLSRLDYSGVGDIIFVNEFLVDSLRIEIYDGWGDIDLKYRGKYLRLIHNIGGVNFSVSGKADDFYLYLADNGQAECAALQTRLSQVWSLSTGNCRINVTEKLNARLSYIGNVYYKGNPPIVESTIESTGKLISE